MWVARTAKEQKEFARHQRAGRFGLAFLAFLGSSLLMTFIRAGSEAVAQDSCIVPIADVIQRVPISLLIGVCLGVICFLCSNKKSTLICSRCEEAKVDDGNYCCSCGGVFKRLDDIKWVDNNDLSTRQ